MNEWLLSIVLLSNHISTMEIEKQCPQILEQYQNLSDPEIIRKAIDYRNKYFERKKDISAFCILNSLSHKGNADAKAVLAMFYTDNSLFPKDLKKSFEMTKEAADEGSILAIHNLAVIYSNGIYVKKDIKKAIEYYEKAISKGHFSSKIGLSYAYFTGQGVKQDTLKAIELALSVAQDPNQLGYEEAMTNLGFYYGSLGLKDKKIYWYEKAGDLNEPLAQVNLIATYANDIEVLNKGKALYWFNRAAELRNPEAYFKLGSIYDHGSPIFEKDDKKAIELYTKAAELGNDKAQYKLGYKLFWNNKEQEALEWFLKAANEHGNPNAIVSLYQIYSKGAKGIPKDEGKARDWLERAKENGLNVTP